MKTLKKSSLCIIICFALVSCDWVQDVFWDCDNLQNADLVVENIETTFESEDNDGQAYEIIGLVLNTLKGLKKCQEEKASEAKSNIYRQDISYSDNKSMSNSKIIDTKYLTVGNTKPGEEAKVSDEVTFLVDGYYEITGYADAKEEVNERRENNNENEKPLNRRMSSDSILFGEKIIHISGFATKPSIDNNGHEVYVIRKHKGR